MSAGARPAAGWGGRGRAGGARAVGRRLWGRTRGAAGSGEGVRGAEPLGQGPWGRSGGGGWVGRAGPWGAPGGGCGVTPGWWSVALGPSEVVGPPEGGWRRAAGLGGCRAGTWLSCPGRTPLGQASSWLPGCPPSLGSSPAPSPSRRPSEPAAGRSQDRGWHARGRWGTRLRAAPRGAVVEGGLGATAGCRGGVKGRLRPALGGDPPVCGGHGC